MLYILKGNSPSPTWEEIGKSHGNASFPLLLCSFQTGNSRNWWQFSKGLEFSSLFHLSLFAHSAHAGICYCHNSLLFCAHLCFSFQFPLAFFSRPYFSLAFCPFLLKSECMLGQTADVEELVRDFRLTIAFLLGFPCVRVVAVAQEKWK